MSAPTPPSAPSAVPPNPDRTDKSTFVTKSFNFTAWFSPFQAWLVTVIEYIVDAISWVDSQAGAAEDSASDAADRASDAAGQVILATAEKVAAQAAAAAAQVAAGLTPDPDFGMVIATTASTVVKNSAYTAEHGVLQDVDTSGGAFAITPPSSPTVGQWFGVRDYNQNRFVSGFPWVDYSSDKIIGLSEDCFINVNTVIFTWRGATKGWCV